MVGKLQREIGKQQPFDALEQEVFLNLVRTLAHLSHPFDQLFREHRLTASQYNVLRILRGHGGPLSCQEIIGEMIDPDPDLTRLLDRLESSGWVKRERSSSDRRVVRSSITEEGLAQLANLDDPVLALHRQQLAHLKPAEMKQLITLLERVRAGVGQQRRPKR